jgi:hypothetical protein
MGVSLQRRTGRPKQYEQELLGPSPHPRPAGRNAVDRVTDLQRQAGNRAVAGLLAGSGSSLQRAPGETKATAGPGAAGQLELPGVGSLPIETASWGVERKSVIDNGGRQREPDVQPGATRFKEVHVTRVADEKTADLLRLYEKVVIDQSAENIGNVELRLTRPSAGGAVPAANILLRDASFFSYSRSRAGDPTTETLGLFYDDAEVEGAGKAPAVKNAAAQVSVMSGEKTWDPVPALSWDADEPEKVVASGGPPTPAPRPVHLSFTAPLGPAAGQFSDALGSAIRFEQVTVTPKGRAPLVVGQVLVEGVDVASTGGMSTMKVSLVAEQRR